MSLSDLIIDTSEQGSDAWLAARAGHATGSRFCDIIALSKPDKYGKQRPLKARDDYLWQLATEIVNGKPVDGVNSHSLQWGTDVEPFAREAYEAETGNIVNQIGFIKRLSIPLVGVSLDGIIDDNGTYESKCPKDSVVHMRTWEYGMPEEHIPQVQGGLWIAEREWCDFVSYDPRAHPAMRLYVQRVYRNEAYIRELSASVREFLAEVAVLVMALKNKGGINV